MSGIMLAMATCLLLAACGVSATGAPSGGATTTFGDTITVTPTRCVLPASSVTPTSSAVATQASRLDQQGAQIPRQNRYVVPVTTLPPGVSVGQVQIEIEGKHSGRCDTITMYVGNGLDHSIYATDHHSNCTTVTLEREVNGVWQPVAGCKLETPTRIVEVPHLQSQYVQVPPGAAGEPGGAWLSGTYRVAFSYVLSPDYAGQPTEVDSARFTIQ